MRVLALDLALRTGWALWDGSSRTSGFYDFDVAWREDAGFKFRRFNRWLRAQYPRPEFVVYEQPFVMRSRDAAEIAMGFSTRVKEWCAGHQIPWDTVNGTRLKKWTTGNGRAEKPDMVAAVVRRWNVESPNYDPLDHNEADAIALLHYTLAELVPLGDPVPHASTGKAAP